MYCSKCGKQIRDDIKFCGYCGAPVAATAKKTKPVPVALPTENSEDPAKAVPPTNVEASEKEGKKSGRIFLFGAVGLIVGVLAGIFLMKNLKTPDSDDSLAMVQETQMEETYSAENETETNEFTEESEAEEPVFEENVSPEEMEEEKKETEPVYFGEYILPECTIRFYTVEELRNFSLEELRLARNEIYARHGRSFQAEDLKQYFSAKSWYEPLYSAAEMDALGDSILNEYEIENRNRIVQVESELKEE